MIPAQTIYTIKKNSPNILAWAVQRALNSTSPSGGLYAGLIEDGIYGRATKETVEDFQERSELGVDGIFGPASSGAMAKEVSTSDAALPPGLVYGVCLGESGGLIGAVNWSVAGGVDCSYFQRRVYDSALGDEAVLHRAFDGSYQANLLASQLRERHDTFDAREGVSNQRAWRLAALAHNWPYGGDLISRVGLDGLSPYWHTAQQWVVNIGAKFDDEQGVGTPLEWAQYYCGLPNSHNHPGSVTRFVTSWDVA